MRVDSTIKGLFNLGIMLNQVTAFLTQGQTVGKFGLFVCYICFSDAHHETLPEPILDIVSEL